MDWLFESAFETSQNTQIYHFSQFVQRNPVFEQLLVKFKDRNSIIVQFRNLILTTLLLYLGLILWKSLTLIV